MRPTRCCARWACPSGVKRPLLCPVTGKAQPTNGEAKTKHGQESTDREKQAQAEVQGAGGQPLRPLRPAARLPAQVRHLPDLLPGHGAERGNPGSQKSELVVNTFSLTF